MNNRVRRMLFLTVVISVAAFFTGPRIWPPGPDVPMPPANLLPGYIALSAIEALAFGFAVAFALYGWPAIRNLNLGEPWLNKASFVTLCWFMGNWWMHDNLHMHNGLNMHGLLFIEVAFHITMLACGVTLAVGILRIAKHAAVPKAAHTGAAERVLK
jgi:hypothetical protein